MTKAKLPADPDLAGMQDAAAEAIDAVDHVQLRSNSSCGQADHFLCWEVSCRHCQCTLAAHVEAVDLRAEIAQVRRAHSCPAEQGVTTPAGSCC